MTMMMIMIAHVLISRGMVHNCFSAELTYISSRSDGLNHDIITVFKSYSEATDVRSALRANRIIQEQNEAAIARARANSTDLEHNGSHIKLHRSDEDHHDIGAVYRSGSVGEVHENQCKDLLARRSTMFVAGPVRIVHMSDTGLHLVAGKGKQHLPTGTILIHSGNFTSEGKYEEYLQFDNWLKSVADTYQYRIVVLGEKDTIKYQENWEQMRSLLRSATHVLCDTTVEVCGLRIHGCPWRRHKKSKSLIPRRRKSMYSDIHDVDIVVSHEPSHGRLDSPDYGKTHTGNRDLSEALIHASPGLHLHGGQVQGRGVYFPVTRSPLTVNSCMCDPSYSLMYAAPHVIKATPVDVQEVCVSTWIFAVDELYNSLR